MENVTELYDIAQPFMAGQINIIKFRAFTPLHRHRRGNAVNGVVELRLTIVPSHKWLGYRMGNLIGDGYHLDLHVF